MNEIPAAYLPGVTDNNAACSTFAVVRIKYISSAEYAFLFNCCCWTYSLQKGEIRPQIILGM
jgi:hypothetical protein